MPRIAGRSFGRQKNEAESPVVTKRLERRDNGPLYLSEPHVHAAVVSGSMSRLVRLPEYIEINEWLAANSTPRPSAAVGGAGRPC